MANESVQFKRGTHANLPETKVPGTFLVETDTGAAYVDDTSSSRVQIKDGTKFQDISASGKTFTFTRGDGTTESIDASYSVATQSANGLLSSADKLKLDNIGYAVTAGTTSAYTASVTGATLSSGTLIALRFNAANAANATLNLNGLGAKPIYYKGAAITAGIAPANAVLLLVYDTSQVSTGAWHCVYSYNSNTTYTNASLGQGYGTCSTPAATVAKVVTCANYALTAGGIVVVKFTNAVPANATMNVNSKGAKSIYYKGAAITANIIKAGDTAAFVYDGTRYQLFAIDREDNTTYTFTNGLSASGTTVSNSGVRSVATGTSNGTISVNTNGTAANVAVKGLGTAAYTAATNYVAKAGDTMTGALYVDVTQTSLPNLTSYADVRGIFGVRLSDSLALPIIHAAGAGNASAGAGLAVTGGGLTIIGGGENTPLGILHNAIAGSGTTGAAGTALNPRTEEIALASDNGVSIFTGGTTASPNAYIDNDGIYHGAIELAGAKGLITSIAGGVTTVRKKWTKNSMGANAGVWQKIADGSLTGNNDINILFEVVDTLTHSHGILRLGCRVSTVNGVANTAITDVDNVQGPRLSWLCRDKELNPEHFRLNYKQRESNGTYTRGLWELQFYHHRRYYATVFTVLTEEGTNGIDLPDYTLYEGATASDISNGTTVVSTDVIPIGGTWNSSNFCTENAKGITIGAYGKCTTSTEGNISIGGYASRTTSATGSWAIAVGSGANSSGANATAVGAEVTASGNYSTALGFNNTASGTNAIAIGSTNTAAGIAFGYGNTASNSYTGTIGVGNTASGVGSNAYGRDNTVSGENAYVIGGWNNVSGEKSVVLGTDNTTYSERIYVLGSNNSLNRVAGNGGYKQASYSVAIGKGNTIEPRGGGSSFEYGLAIGGDNTVHNPGIAIGSNNTINITTTPSAARRDFGVVIGGWSDISQYNAYAIGYGVTNNSNGAFVCGRQNKVLTANTDYTGSTTGDVFAVGNGYSQTDSSSPTGYRHVRSNAFRITYTGAVYAKAAYKASGADYAEFVKEWWDGNPDNEDRVGYMVTVKDGKLHKAEAEDYILGITSGNPSVVGNADEDYFWMYERDEFNRPVYEEIPDIVPKLDEDGNPLLDDEGNVIYEDSGTTIRRFKFREDYDPSLQDSYIERKDRPEWDYVGMRGIVPCRDDGTCEVGGFCKCGTGGIATKADTRGFDTYYVIERINDHVISVEVK